MKIFSILGLYASRLFISAFTAVLSLLFVIICAFDFTEIQRKTSSKLDVSYAVKIKLVLLKVPFIMEQILPFLVFIACLYIFWRMNRNNELVVTRAAGISVWQLIFPVMLCAWVIGAVDILFFNEISSNLMDRAQRLENTKIKQQKQTKKLTQSGIWIREQDPKSKNSFIYKIGKVDPNDSEIFEISIYQFDQNEKFLSRIDATSGSVEKNHIFLRDVWTSERNELPKHSSSLEWPTNMTLDRIQNTDVHYSTVSFLQLPGFIDLLKQSGLNSRPYDMYFYSLIARAIWLGFMVLLAATFTFAHTRSGNTTYLIIIGLGCGFLLYFLRDFTYALGSSGAVSPVVASMLPPLITMILGSSLLLHREDG